MKKTIFATLVFIMSIALAACAGNNSERKADTNETVTQKQPGTIHLTKAEFLKKVVDYEKSTNEWKYLGDKPCIIDFYASWCGPCKSIAPVLEDLAKEYDGQIYIYKINTEEQRELAAAFGIQSIPTLIFCPMNGNPQIAQGAMPKESFRQAINEILLKKK